MFALGCVNSPLTARCGTHPTVGPLFRLCHGTGFGPVNCWTVCHNSYQDFTPTVADSDPTTTRHPRMSLRSLSESHVGAVLAVDLEPKPAPFDDGKETRSAHQSRKEAHENFRRGTDRRSSIAKMWSHLANLASAMRGTPLQGDPCRGRPRANSVFYLQGLPDSDDEEESGVKGVGAKNSR